MAWQDRVTEAAYTPSGGDRLTFLFEDVSRNVTLRGTAFEFPDANGTLVQRTGNSSRRYPLRVFFSGENHDLEAAAFEEALLVSGVGKLEHPFYGDLDVVPFGDVGRRDDLVTSGNQTVVDVTFWNTLDVAYPTSQNDPGTAVISAVDEYNIKAAEEFEDTIKLGSATNRAAFVSRYEALQSSVRAGLAGIAEQTDEVSRQFDAIDRSINTSITVLARDPITLASQTIQLIQSPSRSAAAISDKIEAYGNLARTVISQGVAVLGLDDTPNNTFHTADLFASTYISGMVLSVVNNEFQTRPGALEAAEVLLATLEDVTAWRDDNYASLEESDTGGIYQQIQESVALAAGFLVDISFTLKQERSLVLTRNRTPVDLCAELYGQVDEVLQFFIDSNGLSWQEHLEIQEGRRVVYYI